MTDHFVIRRQYSAIAPPPIRGYVLVGTPDGETEEMSIDRFAILAVSVCNESTWHRRDQELDQCKTEARPYSAQQLAEQGFRPSSSLSSLVPVILLSTFRGEPDADADVEEPSLVLVTECDLAPYRVIWCTWPEAEDEQRLEPAVRRFRDQFKSKGSSD